MPYSPPGFIPTEPGALAQFLMGELDRISVAVSGTVSSVQYEPLAVAPKKPRKGLTVYADGTNWNPGSGEGVYRYDGTTWYYLG